MPNIANIPVGFEALPKRLSGSHLRREVFPRQLFIQLLCLERKRAERSSRPFVLMLLESATLLQRDRDAVLDRVFLALFESTRDTDILGWYQEWSVLGVVFTELGSIEASTIETLSRKVTAALHTAIGVKQLLELNIRFYLFPDDSEAEAVGHHSFSVLYPDLVQESDSNRCARLVKRGIDIVGSASLLLVLLPLFLVLACAVKATSPGPVFFRQKRLGIFGQAFTFLKFRSMSAGTDHAIHEEYMKRFIADRHDSDHNGNHQKVFKLQHDPRVTRLGVFLRRSSLDELPQLFNVLMGHMSLVGPRPPVAYEVASYEIWHRRRLLGVKPGITGLWQVHGRSRVKFDDMVRMDLQYAKDWSLWLDIKILLRTPIAVFSGTGAY